MRELKGETTVFYSTHILDDVQRVSDHVAILDHGRLVKAAPTQVLLGSFTAQHAARRPRRCDGGDRERRSARSRGVASVTVVVADGDEIALRRRPRPTAPPATSSARSRGSRSTPA